MTVRDNVVINYSNPINRRKKRKKKRVFSSSGPIAKWLLLLIMVLVITLVFLPSYIQRYHLEKKRAVLEQEKSRLLSEKQVLLKELDWLDTEAAVEQIAREELGLVKPGERVILLAVPEEQKQ